MPDEQGYYIQEGKEWQGSGEDGEDWKSKAKPCLSRGSVVF
jgi:hypothetical protein